MGVIKKIFAAVLVSCRKDEFLVVRKERKNEMNENSTPGNSPGGEQEQKISPGPVPSPQPAAETAPDIADSVALPVETPAEPAAVIEDHAALPAETPADLAAETTPVIEDSAALPPETPEIPLAADDTASEKSWKSSSQDVWPRSAVLARARQAEKAVKEWIDIYGNKFEQFEFAFNYVAGQNRVHVVFDEFEVPSELWFIGDLHGDILALESALSYIDSHSVSPTIVFLGDLFDRFDYGLEVVMRVIALIRERPGKILWIAGNHDAGLFYKDGKFGADFTPAEFVDFLNAHPEYETFGKWLAEFTQKLPCALFLPDGLFAAHGGCPGQRCAFDPVTLKPSGVFDTDKVQTLEDLNTPEFIKSFIASRIVNNANSKSSLNCEVGKKQLIHFMETAEKLLNIPVKRMLRGHDHCLENRHEFFDFYAPEAPVLTMVTMSTWYLGKNQSSEAMTKSLRKTDVTTPAIAKFRYGEFPEVITLDIPLSVVEQFHKIAESEIE